MMMQSSCIGYFDVTKFFNICAAVSSVTKGPQLPKPVPITHKHPLFGDSIWCGVTPENKTG